MTRRRHRADATPLFQNALAISIVAIAAGTACTVAELLRPARPVAYRQVLLRDCAAFVVYIAVFYPAALELSTRFARHVPMFERYWHAPLALRMLSSIWPRISGRIYFIG